MAVLLKNNCKCTTFFAVSTVPTPKNSSTDIELLDQDQ